MAASSMCRDESDQFMQWLESRLLQLNADLDVSVFVMYICGILESYSGYDDKKEVLLDIVGEIAEDNKEAVCDELIQKWDEMSNTDSKQGEESTTTAIDERLSQMLGNTHVTTNCTEKKSKQLSEEERARKEAILAQYSNICDETDLDDKTEAIEKKQNPFWMLEEMTAPSSIFKKIFTIGTLIAAAAATIPAASSINFSLEHNQNKENKDAENTMDRTCKNLTKNPKNQLKWPS
ncbi:unnamed protein product [Acanthosepion pharaonis]|uniref:Coiled-coil domain-containing protein 43 n=1 Tax=Acanthosepion pharaonis TaxID=158019 RepID=A0A812EQ01_ACAPH|nr:unnamed protein product [Sepia pharaonis]